MSRVSVVVVSYNTRETLRRCLESLGEADEVVVVDNASGDGSAEMVGSSFPSALLIRNESNRGFGAACNQGMDACSGDVVLFLNSDAAARPGAVRELASVMDARPDVVACGGRLEFPDGRLQESCASSLTLWAVFCEQTWLEKMFPRSRVLSPYWMSRRLLESRPALHDASGTDRGTRSRSGVFDVEQVMGACLMVRRVATVPLSPKPSPPEGRGEVRFDERFFLYCEDTELCYRLRRHGRIVWVPSAVFVHELGSSSQQRWEAVARYNRGKELFFAIHHGRWAALVCFVLDRLGALLRALVWGAASLFTLFLVTGFRERFLSFVRVLFAPVFGPPRPDTDMP